MHDTAKIKQLRLTLGLTQAQAAARAQISAKHWCNVERRHTGRKKGITLALLAKVAGALGVRTRDLVL